jgi:hypothetical protein
MCTHSKILLGKIQLLTFGDVGLINQTPTQDKSSPYNRNFWLAITYYFKDSKKYCHRIL